MKKATTDTATTTSHPSHRAPPQPSLLRSRSSAPSSDTLQSTSYPSSSTPRSYLTYRSRSTSRTRPSVTDRQNDESNVNSTSSHGVVSVARKSRSAPPSPSAWALSSGRALSTEVPPDFTLPPPAVKSEDQRTRGKNGAVSKVLKYFKQKKASPSAEEEFHKFRILHNRLVQWRFVDARARASIDSVQRKAQVLRPIRTIPVNCLF
ncbi:hypothetical protein MLD38_033593 [Melastoma candidum]|uniref:Uncharacterized protein n=1 Tax=Melastoma candidum TaxID=119954 RepID=A0ACB9MBL5_9MYRT|nr:hypothetical protein MLD38_033593 [Melastoma candidum]